jgi:hypothetical protein
MGVFFRIIVEWRGWSEGRRDFELFIMNSTSRKLGCCYEIGLRGIKEQFDFSNFFHLFV